MLLQEVPRQERRHRVSNILRTIGMADFENRLPTQLSGGQQQRVAVARAMVSEPAIILADEPTANLDSATSGALLDMMRTLNQDTGMTFVFSTHDGSVMERARRLIILKDGRIDSDTSRE
jgi:putative ABC transport system ATP-binding protein